MAGVALASPLVQLRKEGQVFVQGGKGRALAGSLGRECDSIFLWVRAAEVWPSLRC